MPNIKSAKKRVLTSKRQCEENILVNSRMKNSIKRLEKTVETAKQNNIKNFTTTLLSSPYQKHDVIKQMCEDMAKENDLNFVYVDPRKIHYDGVHKIKKLGLYSQRYCGCKLSIR